MHLYPQDDGFVVTWFDRGFNHNWKISVESKKLSLMNPKNRVCIQFR
jgi:hypothetical protein